MGQIISDNASRFDSLQTLHNKTRNTNGLGLPNIHASGVLNSRLSNTGNVNESINNMNSIDRNMNNISSMNSNSNSNSNSNGINSSNMDVININDYDNNKSRDNENDNSLITMNIESIEKALEESRWWRACVAGSIAGLAEHSLLYPVDTVKTRLQSIVHHKDGLHYKGFTDAFVQIVRHEGTPRLFRGLPAVLTAAIPSHAAYFGSYEYAKYRLGVNKPGYHVSLTALCGVFATMSHDLIVTPFDVIKQRMQLKNCPYANICQCAIKTFKREGILSFVRSYPTTVVLNIPVFSTNFVCYESMKIFLHNKHGKYYSIISEDTWLHHLLAGGFAGACAGLVSNPLDLIKTTIQTEKSQGYRSINETIKKIMNEHPHRGFNVFLAGANARIIYFIPSAAITWTTYEAVKKYLNFPIHDLEMH